MWNLPRWGIEPMSSALASRFLTTVPSGESLKCVFWIAIKKKKKKTLVFSSHWETRTGNLKFCKHTLIANNQRQYAVPLSLSSVCVLVAQLCLTVCNPMNCSPPASSVHGILQARILKWVASPFSRGSSQPRDWTWVFHTADIFFTIWTTWEATCLS